MSGEVRIENMGTSTLSAFPSIPYGILTSKLINL